MLFWLFISSSVVAFCLEFENYAEDTLSYDD